jgi:hypothetical protein
MDWNQMQGFYMPQQQNNTFTNPYMQQLQGMLGMFSNQYGGPNRQPTLPQFGSYNPGFGGPTSFFDQMRGGGGGMGGGMYGREYDRRAAYEHARQQPDFDWENYGESMDGPRMPYGSNGGGFGGRGGRCPVFLTGCFTRPHPHHDVIGHPSKPISFLTLYPNCSAVRCVWHDAQRHRMLSSVSLPPFASGMT